MKQCRDISEAQFRKAAEKEGFKPEGFGYWQLAAPHEKVSVCRFNGGERRRSQLAYLIACQRERGE